MLIPASLRKMASVHCQEENTRYAAALQVEREADGTPWLVATNGRILLAATFTEQPAADNQEPMKKLVPATVLRQAFELAKNGNGSGRDGKFVAVNDVVENCISAGGVSYHYPPTEKTFPEWKRVAEFADKKDVISADEAKGRYVRVRLNIELVATLMEYLSDLKLYDVELDIPCGEVSPLRFTAKAEDGGCGVKVKGYLMPLG